MNYTQQLVIVGLAGIVSVSGCSTNRNGRMEGGPRPSLACPSTPNCVSSYAVGTTQYVPPIRYEGDMDTAKTRLVSAIQSLEHSRIVATDGQSIRAEFTSALFGFVDDVEVIFDDMAKVIHVKSASQVGYFDFGVNRKRVEQIRERFVNLQTPEPK